jgi:hypothetical protein
MARLDDIILILVIVAFGLLVINYINPLMQFIHGLSLYNAIFLLFHIIEIGIISMLAAYIIHINRQSKHRDSTLDDKIFRIGYNLSKWFLKK